MFSVLLLLLSPALAWIPTEDWGSGNVTASEGVSGQCVCHVFLPDTTFPADRVEHMQQISKDMIIEVEIQINKLVSYEAKLEVYLKDLSQLTLRVAMLESSSPADKYIKLDFELLRTELREFEALVSQLKESLNISSPLFDSLYTEIQNMTMIVNQLETYDKSNLELIRIEFAKLQKKLEDCQQDQKFEPDIGNCNGTGIMSLSKPNVIQFNAHLSSTYVYGGWAKDSKPLRGYESMYVYSGDTGPRVQYFYLYPNYDKLILRSTFKSYSLSYGWRGSGNNFAVRGHSIYYQRNSNEMCKINVTTDKYDYRVVSEASSSFSYTYSLSQILDFAGDENGLWVMYASEASKGKIVVAKLDEKAFGIEEKWSTDVYKQLAGNAFMACGVMYATRSVDLTTEEIFYSLDTRTGEERHLSIPFQKFQEKYSYLDYNPTDQKLYMYNNGYYVSYNVKFNQ